MISIFVIARIPLKILIFSWPPRPFLNSLLLLARAPMLYLCFLVHLSLHSLSVLNRVQVGSEFGLKRQYPQGKDALKPLTHLYYSQVGKLFPA